MSKLGTLRPRLPTANTQKLGALPKLRDAELNTPEHREWRRLVLERAGHRCEAVDDGARCAVRAPARLFADHIRERGDGGDLLDPRNGQCLCGSHHTAKTAAARAARHARPTPRPPKGVGGSDC